MEYAISSASINLTKRCNLRCSYCFTGGKANEVISLDMAKKSVDFLIKSAVSAPLETFPYKQRIVDISFWGGEPLLEWDLLKEIVLYAKSVKPPEIELAFGGTTNGVLLTPEKLDFLEQHNVLFMISIDGTEETHDRYRKDCFGVGSHKRIMENAPEVLKRWPFYKVRMSLYPDRIDHFYEDCKYLIDNGFTNLYFSPVYEYEWTDKHWQTFTEQGFKVVDLISEYQKNGKEIKIEHFISYTRMSDGLIWPCGAGRHYIGIDTDGSLWPCHRFIKFEDTRPWQEKEWCFGHVEHGITKPEVRNKFIEYTAGCVGSECNKITPCHGGCYAANLDLENDIATPHKQICSYVEAQKNISNYYKQKVKIIENSMNTRGCICYNMCYLQGTKDEIIDIDQYTDTKCHCYNTNYSGQSDPKSAEPLSEDRKRLYMSKVTPLDVMNMLNRLDNRLNSIELILQKILEK